MLAIIVIITAIGVVDATTMWLVSQSAHAASCQEFLTNGEVTKQHCSSDTSIDHANSLNNDAHFQHRNH